jgi:hypothetical protein
VKWCGALATRGRYCPVHARLPRFDSRSDQEAYAAHDAKPMKLPRLRPRRDKPLPVDARPLIRVMDPDDAS